MIFISQTPADAEGNYTTTWKSQDGSIVTVDCNLFEQSVSQMRSELEEVRLEKFKKSVQQLYAKLNAITQDELEMSLDEFVQLHESF